MKDWYSANPLKYLILYYKYARLQSKKKKNNNYQIYFVFRVTICRRLSYEWWPIEFYTGTYSSSKSKLLSNSLPPQISKNAMLKEEMLSCRYSILKTSFKSRTVLTWYVHYSEYNILLQVSEIDRIYYYVNTGITRTKHATRTCAALRNASF